MNTSVEVLMGCACAFALSGCSLLYGALGEPSSAAAPSDECGNLSGSYAKQKCLEKQAKEKEWAPKQAAFDALFTAEIAEFREIAAPLGATDTATPEIAARAEALRDRFVRRCLAESGWSYTACWQGTFARDITIGLAKIKYRLGDEMGAALEVYTVAADRDLRSAEAKIAVLNDTGCFDGDAWCPDLEEVVGKDLARLKGSSGTEDRTWRVGSDVAAVQKGKGTAVVTFKPEVFGAGTSRVCGDPEWQSSAAGEVLVRPCRTEYSPAQTTVFPPAVVPLAEIGDFKVTEKTGALVLYATSGKREGHVLETWEDTGKLDTYGRRKVLKTLSFRGMPAPEAKPGLP